MIKLTFLFSWALKFDLNSEPGTRCYKKEKASSGENWKTMIVSILYSVMVLLSIVIFHQIFHRDMISTLAEFYCWTNQHRCSCFLDGHRLQMFTGIYVHSNWKKNIKSIKMWNLLCHLNSKCLKHCSSEMW